MLSLALTALAAQATLVTRTPPLVSLLVEPFSLLLLPGVVIAIVIASPRDFSLNVALEATVLLYTLLLYLVLVWRARSRERQAVRELRRHSR